MESSMKSKYLENKYDHSDKHIKKTHHHRNHKHHKRREYSRSRSYSRSHSYSRSRSHSHSRFQKIRKERSKSRIDHDRSHNRNYPSRNYKSDKKEYFKNNQYTSSSHRINTNNNSNNLYSKSNYKKERSKYGINISNNNSGSLYREKNREKDKEEKYKMKEYEYKEYKENKIDNRNNISNYSNSNSIKSKIVINLLDDKKEKESKNFNNNKDDYLSQIQKEEIKEEKDPKNKIYFFITKNDKMKLLFRIYHNFSSNSNNNLSENDFLTFTEKKYHQSIRNDIWAFKLYHKYINNTQGGKIYLDIKIRKNNSDSYNKEKEINNSSIIEILDSLTFNIEFNITYNSYRSHNNSLSNISYDTLYTTQEVIIPPEYYNNINNINALNEIPFVVELLVSKNFNNISKLDKGQYNGIKNEGATCYMNSMLQTLYSIHPFKKAVFQIPTDKDDNSSIVLSLQRLFYDLITNHSPVSARNLINSFGWTREQIQIQHDVQEFNQLLIEEMEKKMKGTSVEGSFNKMLTGKYNNYIQCIDFDYRSEIEEKFNEIQLTVKGYKNIYQSFDSYTAEEILDNENKYETEKYGKQKAKKGIKFVSFPPVLFLQLKRFEYNSKKDIMVKINDYFEYYNEIDLTNYVDPLILKSSKKENFLYELHSVIVHQGNANSGHYYAYIKQSNNNRDWLLFNDENVRPADNYEIFRQNFGGQCETYKNKGNQGEIVSSYINYERSAYILVYIQKVKINKFIYENNLEIIPNYLKKRFENEKEDEKNAANKKKRDLENINIFLFSNLNCNNQNNKLGIINSLIDLNIDAPFAYNMNSRLLINFPQNIKINDFINFIHKKTMIPKNQMILYEYEANDDFSILKRQNFEIKLIENLDMTLAEYKIKTRKTFLIFFLYVREPYVAFTNLGTVKDLCEEYRVGASPDEKKSVIFISRTYNKFSFKMNNGDLIQKLNNNFYNDDLLNNCEETNIIFIKEYDCIRKEYTMIKIFDVNINDNNIYKKILHEYNTSKKSNDLYKNKSQSQNVIYFLLENGYLISDDYKDNLEANNCACAIIIDEENIYNYLNKIKCLILIPIFKEEEKNETIKFISDLNKVIYIDINCIKCFGDEENAMLINQKMKKMKIKLRKELNEEELKNIIRQNLEEKQIMSKLCEKVKMYYIDNNKKTNVITEEYLKNNNNYTINFVKNNYEKEEMINLVGKEYNDYPILKYFDLQNARINLELNLYENICLQDTYYQEFNIFDINNNYVSKLSILIPKKIRKTNEILEYIKFFLDDFFKLNNFELNNYFFLLQKRNYNYLYQILTNANSDLKIFESKFKDIEYRIQPFYNEEINKIYNSEYKKIFVTFTEYNYFYPLIIYQKPEDNFKFIKNEMMKKIEKMAGLRDMEKNSFYSNNRIEFYIYKGILSQDRMLPDKLIKDDDTVASVFKETSGAYNLLISFVEIH